MNNYFIAILPKELHENKDLMRLYSKFKRTMSERGKETRWVKPDLWHVTLQFLGPLESVQIKKVLELLQDWSPSDNFKKLSLRLQGFGAFPNVEDARILWTGVQRSQQLLDAKIDLENELKKLDLHEERRDYTPHMTLARFRNPLNVHNLIQLGGRKFIGEYDVSEILLLESVIQNHMVKHVPIFTKKLYN